MTKDQFIGTIQPRLGFEISKAKLAEVFAVAEAIISNQIRDTGEATWPGMVKFEVKTLAARPFRNPQTGEVVQVGERDILRAKPFGRFASLIGG